MVDAESVAISSNMHHIPMMLIMMMTDPPTYIKTVIL